MKWIRRYIGFHNIRNPVEMEAAEVEAFLSHLAVEGNVAASTQNQALAALLFLYREVLNVDLPWLEKFTPAKKSDYVPVVLTKEEVRKIIEHLTGTNWLITSLLYGAGLRLLRHKEISTTMIYTHVLQNNRLSVRSSIDLRTV